MPGGTVLIVDDEADVRDALKETLEYEGYRTAETANGREALEYLRSHPRPCLVLLDLMMPVMNGFDFLKAVKEDPDLRSVSVLLVSAAAREQVDAAFRSGAAVGALAKPVQLKALLSAVERFC